MAPEPISAPTLSAPRPIAPRRNGRAAARYRHSFDDQSSVWCLEAGLGGFTQGAQAGGRLVFRRALPENDAAQTPEARPQNHHCGLKSASRRFDRSGADRSMRHRPFAPDRNQGRGTATKRNVLNDLSRRSMIGGEAPSSRVVVSTPSASVLVTPRFSGGVSVCRGSVAPRPHATPELASDCASRPSMYSSMAVSGISRRLPTFTLRISPDAILLKKLDRPSPVQAIASGTDNNRLGIFSTSTQLCSRATVCRTELISPCGSTTG